MEEATRRRRLLCGALVFSLCLVGTLLLVATPTRVETAPYAEARRTVRVVRAELRSVQLLVHSQRTVVPRVESELVPEISGRVVWVAPALAAGGYFQSGDPLVRIDAADYEAALRRARASVIRSEAEHANARHQLEHREALAGSSVLSEEQLEHAHRAKRVSFANLEEARERHRRV